MGRKLWLSPLSHGHDPAKARLFFFLDIAQIRLYSSGLFWSETMYYIYSSKKKNILENVNS